MGWDIRSEASTVKISKLVKASLVSACLLTISRLACISASDFEILTNMYNP